MEFFPFCVEIIKREAERFNVGIDSSIASQLTAANTDEVNYDNAHNRCAFLYRCGPINMSFAKDCFSKFLLDCNGLEYLFAKWKFTSQLNFCFISKGPALEYIALLLSHEQCRELTSLIGNVRIITKHGAWRNSANTMLDIINKGYSKNIPPSVGNIEVIQGDPFNNFSEKVKLPINDSGVVVMMKALNFLNESYDQVKVSKAIQEFLDALKPGAILFCIDTKPSVKKIVQLLTTIPGKFLFEPTNINTMINLEHTDVYKTHFGSSPIVSGRGNFFVWEKCLVFPPKVECELNEISRPAKHTIRAADKVAAVGSSVEPTCKSPLSKETKYDQQLPHFSSTPQLWEVKDAANTFENGSRDLHSADNVNCYSKKSNYSLSLDSLLNSSSSVFDHVKKESLKLSLSSLRSELEAISNDICIQTEPEEFLKGTEISKVTELSNKIADLTIEMTKLLVDNPDNCCKNSEAMCSSPEPKVNTCPHCSSEISYSRISQNFRACCCCEKYVHQPSCSSAFHDSNNVSICGEVSNCCSPSNNVRSNILSTNVSPSAAQLVIPLTNLSADIVSQIISLITQANPK